MNWKRLSVIVALVVMAAGGAYAYLMRQEKKRLAAVDSGPPVLRVTKPSPPNRAWRWPTESEWVVHQVVRRIASWALLAGNASLEQAQVRVRRGEGDEQPGTFEVELTTAAGPQALSVRPAGHVWDPAAYADVARTLLGPGGTPTADDPVAAVDGLLLASDTTSLRKADAALFHEMSRRPRDPVLHEQAALLWAAHALRESEGGYADRRPFVNAIAAHLALAHSLRQTGPPSRPGEIAGVVLDALLDRQVEAMAALDGMASRPESVGPWMTSLRLRITHDPRLIPRGPKLSRLEQLEGARALYWSRGCRQAVEQARSWRLPPAADWIRATVGGCSEPELTQLSAGYLELLAQDAARLLGVEAGTLESTVGALTAASAENTHQPSRPASVVCRHVRADAGLAHILSGFHRMLAQLIRLDRRDDIQMLSMLTRSIRENLPQRALFELSLSDAEMKGIPAEVCQRFARLVIDRPDLVDPGFWGQVDRCQSEPSLKTVHRSGSRRRTVVPGTGLLGTGLWQAGLDLSGHIAEAAQRAPWDAGLADYTLLIVHKADPPAPAVRQAHEKLLEYDLSAMAYVAIGLRDADDDEVQRLAERICEINAEKCAEWADYLAMLGREDAAEKMWRRALADARDEIPLSNDLGRYVNLLLDRGRTDEALRVARRAAEVYSAGGLFTLAFTFERLGRFDQAAAEYRKITERYGGKFRENAFYLRYRHRHGGDRFAKEAALATAELFPHGLVRKSLDDFRRERHQGGVMQQKDVDARLRRIGVRPNDFVVGVDGFAVTSDDQMSLVLTLTDEPQIRVIVMRVSPPTAGASARADGGWVELNGPYRRWKYGLLTPLPKGADSAPSPPARAP